MGTLMYWSQPNEIFRNTLLKIKSELVKAGYVGLKTKNGFHVCVCVVVPPFPFEDKKEAFIYKDLSIIFKKNNTDGMHLGDVKMINGTWVVAGETGYVLVATGSGLTVDDARRQVYSRINNIILQNMFYRTDIGVKWYEESDKLQTWGYLY